MDPLRPSLVKRGQVLSTLRQLGQTSSYIGSRSNFEVTDGQLRSSLTSLGVLCQPASTGPPAAQLLERRRPRDIESARHGWPDGAGQERGGREVDSDLLVWPLLPFFVFPTEAKRGRQEGSSRGGLVLTPPLDGLDFRISHTNLHFGRFSPNAFSMSTTSLCGQLWARIGQHRIACCGNSEDRDPGRPRQPPCWGVGSDVVHL